MQKIFKYQLGVNGESVIIDSKVKEFLHVDSQDGWPMVWALIDSEIENTKYEILSVGTGWIVPDIVTYESKYLGTVIDGAGFVWHYFVRRVADGELR